MRKLNKRACLTALMQGEKVCYNGSPFAYIYLDDYAIVRDDKGNVYLDSIISWLEEIDREIVWLIYDGITEKFIKGLRLI